MSPQRPTIALLVVAATAALSLVACGAEGGGDSTSVPQPTTAQMAASGLAELPVAPESERADLEAASFSNPTEVTNPLFPISELHSAILSGKVDGKPFHTETTLLPYTREIEWAPGQHVETVISQYVAYLDGRIEEVAQDYYAQADDGSVWYFGEDVYNYSEAGVIADTDGTWLAGKEGPAAMIMPADPAVGDVHRPENIPGVVFEEVEVSTVDNTVDGPSGPVEGAIIARELHDDGSFSDKEFAPGYGEFFSAHEGDVEALALAAPTDALGGPVPSELEAISAAADEAFEASRIGQWPATGKAVAKAAAAWNAYRGGEVPPRLAIEMDRAIAGVEAAVAGRREAAASAAIDVAQSTLDLELRHRPPVEIDQARFELWARQLEVDAAATDLDAVSGDLATLEWVRDRFAHTVEEAGLTQVDSHLNALRDSVVDEDLAAVGEEAAGLRETVAGLG